MNVLFIAKDKDDPATRYRVLPLKSRLAELNIDTSICDSADGIKGKLRLLSKASAADLVFIQRKLLAPWLVSALKRRCSKLVYDFDDAIFSKSSGKSSNSRMAKFRKILDSSDLVLAGNAYLAEQCRLACPNVYTIVVPTPVDQSLYDRDIEKQKGCVLVWVGSSSTRKYLEFHRDIFEEIGSRFPNVSLRVIADFDFKLDKLPVENIRWSSETESRELGSAHIGIAPMIDNQYTRGKCALKIIQYMAAGLPVISSSVGANSEVIVDGETGFLVDSLEDWIEAVEHLETDPSIRDKMGSAGYRRMQEKYSQQAVVESIVENLKARQLITDALLA